MKNLQAVKAALIGKFVAFRLTINKNKDHKLLTQAPTKSNQRKKINLNQKQGGERQ